MYKKKMNKGWVEPAGDELSEEAVRRGEGALWGVVAFGMKALLFLEGMEFYGKG